MPNLNLGFLKKGRAAPETTWIAYFSQLRVEQKYGFPYTELCFFLFLVK